MPKALGEVIQSFTGGEKLISLISNYQDVDDFFGHATATAYWVDVLVGHLGLRGLLEGALRHAVLYHDVGILFMLPLARTTTPYPKRCVERNVLRFHPELGAKWVLSALVGVWKEEFYLASVAALIANHHREFAWRSGYPRRFSDIRSNTIVKRYPEYFEPHGIFSLPVAILHAADSIASLTVDQPFRAKRSIGEALRVIVEDPESVSKYHPMVLTELKNLLGQLGAPPA